MAATPTRTDHRWGRRAAVAGGVVVVGVAVAYARWSPAYSGLFGLFPSTAAGFKGNAAVMREYLRRNPIAQHADTAANQLAWDVTGDLTGTQFGYQVAGIQHHQRGNTVMNATVAPPIGQTPVYVILGLCPYSATQVIIGKYYTVHGVSTLWQVYAQNAPASTLAIIQRQT